MELSIAGERQSEFARLHPDKPVPDVNEFLGPPYTPTQQAEIDKAVDRSQRNSELRSWVGSMGLLQYILAPIAFLWALSVVRHDKSRWRLAGIAACILNGACIAVMLYRGYFSSLSW